MNEREKHCQWVHMVLLFVFLSFLMRKAIYVGGGGLTRDAGLRDLHNTNSPPRFSLLTCSLSLNRTE